jgi:TonB family protein
MSESSIGSRPAVLPNAAPSLNYRLSDELARLSLPGEYKDSYRKLAYANSICLLFVTIGLIGIKSPGIITRPLSQLNEPVPVVFTPPEEQPKLEQPKADEEPPPQDQPLDAPQIAPIVAAVDSPAVAFAVPVEGAVTIAKEARLAAPPPPVTQQQQTAPKGPVQFNPNGNSNGGSYPKPEYPRLALRNQYQGTVMILFTVDELGKVSEVKLQKSSGFGSLDEAALETVKNRWRFPPGKPGMYITPVQFQLQ